MEKEKHYGKKNTHQSNTNYDSPFSKSRKHKSANKDYNTQISNKKRKSFEIEKYSSSNSDDGEKYAYSTKKINLKTLRSLKSFKNESNEEYEEDDDYDNIDVTKIPPKVTKSFRGTAISTNHNSVSNNSKEIKKKTQFSNEIEKKKMMKFTSQKSHINTFKTNLDTIVENNFTEFYDKEETSKSKENDYYNFLRKNTTNYENITIPKINAILNSELHLFENKKLDNQENLFNDLSSHDDKQVTTNQNSIKHKDSKPIIFNRKDEKDDKVKDVIKEEDSFYNFYNYNNNKEYGLKRGKSQKIQYSTNNNDFKSLEEDSSNHYTFSRHKSGINERNGNLLIGKNNIDDFSDEIIEDNNNKSKSNRSLPYNEEDDSTITKKNTDKSYNSNSKNAIEDATIIEVNEDGNKDYEDEIIEEISNKNKEIIKKENEHIEKMITKQDKQKTKTEIVLTRNLNNSINKMFSGETILPYSQQSTNTNSYLKSKASTRKYETMLMLKSFKSKKNGSKSPLTLENSKSIFYKDLDKNTDSNKVLEKIENEDEEENELEKHTETKKISCNNISNNVVSLFSNKEILESQNENIKTKKENNINPSFANISLKNDDNKLKGKWSAINTLKNFFFKAKKEPEFPFKINEEVNIYDSSELEVKSNIKKKKKRLIIRHIKNSTLEKNKLILELLLRAKQVILE